MGIDLFKQPVKVEIAKNKRKKRMIKSSPAIGSKCLKFGLIFPVLVSLEFVSNRMPNNAKYRLYPVHRAQGKFRMKIGPNTVKSGPCTSKFCMVTSLVRWELKIDQVLVLWLSL